MTKPQVGNLYKPLKDLLYYRGNEDFILPKHSIVKVSEINEDTGYLKFRDIKTDRQFMNLIHIFKDTFEEYNNRKGV